MLRRRSLAPATATVLVAAIMGLVFGTGLVRAGHRAPGTIDTVAGTGALNVDAIRAVDASIPFPYGVAVNASGDLFIADGTHCTVRRVSAGWITTVVGGGGCGYSGDGGPATAAKLSGRSGLAFDATGNLFIADAFNCAIRKVDVSTGVIVTVAGGQCGGRSDDGVVATEAYLLNPLGIAVHPNGDLYIADTMNCRVRRVTAGMITTVAGDYRLGGCTFSGDGGPAVAANLAGPEGLAIDAAGDLYISDRDNCRIRKIGGGVITTVAGTGKCWYNGDGPALTTDLKDPFGIAFDRDGGLLIADSSSCLLRRLGAGVITTMAGFQTMAEDWPYTVCGYNGDDQPAVGAMVNAVVGVAADAEGNVYFTDVDVSGALPARVRIIYGDTPPPTNDLPSEATTTTAPGTPAPTETLAPESTPTPAPTETLTLTHTLTPSPSATPTTVAAPTPAADRVVVCHWVPAPPRKATDLPAPEGGSYQVVVVDEHGANGNKALKAHADHERDIIGSDEQCGVNAAPTTSALVDAPRVPVLLAVLLGALVVSGVLGRRWWASRRA